MNPDTGEIGAFERVLSEIDRVEVEPARHLAIQIDNDIKAIIRAAITSGQTSSLTIKIVAKPKGEMIEITGTSSPKLPKPNPGSVRLYADEDGELYQHNPEHAASALPGVDVRTPKRQRTAAPAETPINAKP